VSFAYTPGSGAKDRVRLLIGDTDDKAATDVRLEDEEILELLTMATGSQSPGISGVRRAAADAADVLAAKFARKHEGSSSGPSPSKSRAEELRATASRLRSSASSFAVPSAGGISVAAKTTAETNTDRVPQPFKKGMLDNPDTGSQSDPCPER
jgi:hypothetical protein